MNDSILRTWSACHGEEGAPSAFPSAFFKSALALVVTAAATSQGAQTPGCYYHAQQNNPMLDQFYVILYTKQNSFLFSLRRLLCSG